MEASVTTTDLDLLSVNTIRGLCMDAVQRANSGHPGTPMGIAPVAYTLWQQFLGFDPSDPIWPNRDRFVLSEGHASALLWSLLHLTGVRAVDPDYEILGTPAVSMDDLKAFRQLGSHCPGHPEYRLTSGVEATTGPLGQGVANSVGMATASKWLAARYNTGDFTMFDFNVYALAGDGCMMEGISSEAASLAGHLQLSNLCWIYDSNRVTIEGHTDIAFTEDVAARFLGYGWNVTTVADVNDMDAVARALHSFQAEHERPTLMLVHSHIGYGSPVEDSPQAHGEPLGEDGPTHQPVEQLASLRAMPGLLVFRPADANEVAETWRAVTALRREPAALVLTRQALPTLDRSALAPASGVAQGGYILAEAGGGGQPDAILIATGSEVHLALEARDELEADGIRTRVVSLPCWELFDRQPQEYRDRVLPRAVKARIAIEQASTLGWDRYVGDGGAVIGMHTFGASAPLKQLLTKFGFTPEQVAQTARERVAAARDEPGA
jgi:transketolase